MNELALFAGAGGGLLASKWLLGWRTICYVEIEPYAVACLVARIKDGLLDDAPIWDDARTFDGTRWRGLVDIITAGFPCQPFSVAGKRRGAKDERNLWPDTFRIICEVRPRFILLENVPGILADPYVRRIFGDLAEGWGGFRWRCLSAAEMGANHRRDRVWILAHPKERWGKKQQKCDNRQKGKREPQKQLGLRTSDRMFNGNPSQRTKILEGSSTEISNVANSSGERKTGWNQSENGRRIWVNKSIENGWRNWWKSEPGFPRLANGVAHQMDRLAASGEGQVPAVVKVVWDLLTEGLEDDS